MDKMIRGELLIGGEARRGTGAEFRAFDPTLNAEITPMFTSAVADDVRIACELAAAAFDEYRAISLEERAGFLEAIAGNLERDADELLARAGAETGLPPARLKGELGRTTGQLRLFARVVREGAYLDVRIDHALPERTPPRPDIRLTNQPLGPVVVFGASNFPLAFSVAGGDTASALAAGCPVIVKAHPAHPGTSELAAQAVVRAVADCGLPAGVFALLFDKGIEIGAALTADPRVAAVGFTGSRRGGEALMAIAARRPRPIPVYAEMSSINPVLLLPGALAERGEAIGKAFAGALSLGSGQFCTNPGLILAIGEADSFVAGARAAVLEITPATMLTPGIHAAYRAGVSALNDHDRVACAAQGQAGEGLQGQVHLFTTTSANLRADPKLVEEVFGAAGLLVFCEDADDLAATLEGLEGQLTASVHAAPSDYPLARSLMPRLEKLAGRILFNGFGTGVEVCDAMVHGGPYPATGDGRSTSVGSLAIARFLRPVSYQDVPAELLPAALHEDNPEGVSRRIDGVQVGVIR
jgi:alpha-ketoglutaric semialdehyde dehydrogenase